MPSPLEALLIVALMVVFCCGVSFCIGQFGGWADLAQHYPARDVVLDARWRFQSGRFGWSDYTNCLTVGANAEGLYLAVFFLARPGHTPLFFPWADLTMEQKRWWWKSWVELTARKAPHIAIRLSERLMRKIARTVSVSWRLTADVELDATTKI